MRFSKDMVCNSELVLQLQITFSTSFPKCVAPSISLNALFASVHERLSYTGFNFASEIAAFISSKFSREPT